jgi:phosphorylcholine metabolism protein LicD
MKKFIFFCLIIFLLVLIIIYYIKYNDNIHYEKFINNINYAYKNKIDHNKVHKPCKYKHLILNKKQLDGTKELLLKFIDFTKKNNVDYFIIGGSLIGCIRNGGLLPFDDDIDVAVFEKDIYLIEKYKDPQFYFEKATYGFGYKFKKKNSNLFIDVMIFEKDKENPKKYKIINNLWKNEAIYLDEIYPITEKQYSGFTVNVPYKYNQYLHRAFPKWDKQIRFDCGHHTKKCFYKELGLPRIIDANYNNSMFLCYTDL